MAKVLPPPTVDIESSKHSQGCPVGSSAKVPNGSHMCTLAQEGPLHTHSDSFHYHYPISFDLFCLISTIFIKINDRAAFVYLFSPSRFIYLPAFVLNYRPLNKHFTKGC